MGLPGPGCSVEALVSVGIIARSGGSHAALTAGRRHLNWTTRTAGYGAIDRERPDAPWVSAIAVPVAHVGRVPGCINVVFLGTALSVPEAAGKCPQILRGAPTGSRLASSTRQSAEWDQRKLGQACQWSLGFFCGMGWLCTQVCKSAVLLSAALRQMQEAGKSALGQAG